MIDLDADGVKRDADGGVPVAPRDRRPACRRIRRATGQDKRNPDPEPAGAAGFGREFRTARQPLRHRQRISESPVPGKPGPSRRSRSLPGAAPSLPAPFPAITRPRPGREGRPEPRASTLSTRREAAILTIAVAALLALLDGCATEPLGPETPLRSLVVRNPRRAALRLLAVDGDRRVLVRELGRGAEARLTLRAAHYVLEVESEDGPFPLGVPLPASIPREEPLVVVIPERRIPPHAGWAWIPPGPTVIGDLLDIGQPDEHPAHVVEIDGFFLQRHEVTNAEYTAFLNELGPAPDPAWLAFDSHKCRVLPRGGRFATDAPTEPVVTVSLAGARAYCRWLTAKEGAPCRLPTEAEWEKAARGPEGFVYAYGNRYRQSAANQESGRLEPVGRYPANAFGVHDLTGNAFEWVADPYDATAYSRAKAAPSLAPSAAASIAEHDAEYHVLRGGSFVLDGMYLRTSFRMRQRPTVRTDDMGFRVVREIPASKPGEIR